MICVVYININTFVRRVCVQLYVILCAHWYHKHAKMLFLLVWSWSYLTCVMFSEFKIFINIIRWCIIIIIHLPIGVLCFSASEFPFSFSPFILIARKLHSCRIFLLTSQRSIHRRTLPFRIENCWLRCDAVREQQGNNTIGSCVNFCPIHSTIVCLYHRMAKIKDNIHCEQCV